MKTCKNLYDQIISVKNLFRAYKKARKHKTAHPDVIEFKNNLIKNIFALHLELKSNIYTPKPLQTFTIRDPKTRKISKSAFRDRVVHHALINIIEPIYEKIFICDSYASRQYKGTSAAIQRFDHFKRKVAHPSKPNDKVKGFCLKADIKSYFETIDQRIRLHIIKKKVKDTQVIRLIQLILNNYVGKHQDKGMPLGNLTSQFFANVYLNELDQFVKHTLKAKYYIRYVDDFVILHKNKSVLENYKQKIGEFLTSNLNLTLHPTKSKIAPLSRGIDFLGFRIFYYHKLLRKSGLKRLKRKFQKLNVAQVNNTKLPDILLYAYHAIM